jgi:long-chain acyl-CoA synthetase
VTAVSLDPRERVLEITDRYRSRPYLIDARTSRTVSYGAFGVLAEQSANELQRRGVNKGDRVGIALPNSIEFAAMYFACLSRGAVAVPISLSAASAETAFILSCAGLRLIVVSGETAARIAPAAVADVPVWQIDADDPVHSPADVAQPFRAAIRGRSAGLKACATADSPDDLLSLTFTSGTTGLPKAVAHRAGVLLDAAAAFASAVGLDERTRMAHLLPMSYMAGWLNTLLCPFMAGASVVLCRPFDNLTALSFWDVLSAHDVDAMWLTPTMAAALLRIDRGEQGTRYCREHVRTICVGTAPLPADIRREFEARYGVPMLESYGLSELLFVATERPGEAPASSVGLPLDGVEIEIRAARENGAGDIWVRTPYLMQGYLDYDTQATDDLPRDHWYDTGDIGCLQRDGTLLITGRRKDLIIRGGVNVSPRAVEDVLMGHPAIQHTAVIGLPDALLGERVAAVIVLKNGESLEVLRPSIEALCRDRLNAASRPSDLIAVDRLPVGPSGKVQKHRLREEILGDPGRVRIQPDQAGEIA